MSTVLVLGGSAGVGLAVASEFKQAGCRVIAAHRGKRVERVLNVENLIGDCGSSSDEVRYMAAKLVNIVNPGEIDVVVHSLAGASVGAAMTRTTEQVDRTFNILAHSFLWWVRELWATGALSSHARIVALTSPLSSQYVHNSGVIGPAKAALEAYVRVLASELGIVGVRVNALSFGAVKTDSLSKVNATADFEVLQSRLTPGRAMQTPEDVANLVRWLTLPESDWINGAVIDASGGMTSRLMNYAYYQSQNPPKSYSPSAFSR